MFVIPDHIQFNPHLSTTLKTFVRALAHHCGSKNTCWPSQERIAKFMNCSTRTVQRCLREAVELRLIEVRRRWLKSNVYAVLCLEERELSTMATEGCRIEQDTFKENNVENGPAKPICKSPREIQILVEDLSELVGTETAERNRGWFYKLARTLGYEALGEAIKWVSRKMSEAQVTGYEVRNPSALLCWKLRSEGVPI